jgi:hypothetical protein
VSSSAGQQISLPSGANVTTVHTTLTDLTDHRRQRTLSTSS